MTIIKVSLHMRKRTTVQYLGERETQSHTSVERKDLSHRLASSSTIAGACVFQQLLPLLPFSLHYLPSLISTLTSGSNEATRFHTHSIIFFLCILCVFSHLSHQSNQHHLLIQKIYYSFRYDSEYSHNRSIVGR